jgi:hypothetical protein
LISGLFLCTAVDPANHQRQRDTAQPPVHSYGRGSLPHGSSSRSDESCQRLVLKYVGRLYAGLESVKRAHGGDIVPAEFLGPDPQTIARGRRQLRQRDVALGRVPGPRATVPLHLVLSPKSENWSYFKYNGVKRGLDAFCASTITICIPTPSASRSVTASMTYSPTEDRSWYTSRMTRQLFAAHSHAGWWKRDGATRYRRGRHLLISADTGSTRCRIGASRNRQESELGRRFVRVPSS